MEIRKYQSTDCKEMAEYILSYRSQSQCKGLQKRTVRCMGDGRSGSRKMGLFIL